MPMWDDVKRNLMEWYAVTSDKTVEVAKVTSLRYDKFGISRDIERQFSELGNLVYTALKEGRVPDREDPGVAALVERLEALERELAAKEAEIARVRSQHGARQRKERAATVDDLPDQVSAPVEEAAADPAESRSGEAATDSGENRDETGQQNPG